MLAKLPEAYRAYVKTGSDRLRQLERELLDARAQDALFRKLQSHSPARRLLSRIRRQLNI